MTTDIHTTDYMTTAVDNSVSVIIELDITDDVTRYTDIASFFYRFRRNGICDYRSRRSCRCGYRSRQSGQCDYRNRHYRRCGYRSGHYRDVATIVDNSNNATTEVYATIDVATDVVIT